MEQQTTALAKVSRPILTGIFQRKRLFKILDRMQAHPMIWVTGPPGCGKTMLITSYLEARKLPCLWYQVDEGDQDPATFFYYMGHAAKRASHHRQKPLPPLTPEYLPGLATFTLRYFEIIYSRLKPPFALVFDNYQEVPVNSPFHDVIRHALSTIPENITIFLVSREAPPPVIIHMVANNRMKVLGWQDIRFTEEETAGVVNLQARERLPDKTIQCLHQATDGWAAGLVLMVDKAKTEGIDSEWMGNFIPEEVFDYFASETFGKADVEIQKFLLKTAFLPQMTSKLTEKLTGNPHAGRILSQLNRNHFFTEKRFLKGSLYQFHPLFREFLLNRAKETLPLDDLAEISRHAAMLLEEDGQTEAAVNLLCDMGHWEMVVPLIMKCGPIMLAQGRNRFLEAWLDILPKEMVTHSPWLLFWKGVCKLPFDPSSSQPYFEHAFQQFKAQGDAAGLFLSWSGVVDAITYAFIDLSQLDPWLFMLETLMQEYKTFPAEEIEVRVASSMVLAIAMRQPPQYDIEKWADRVLSANLEDPFSVNARVWTLSHLSHHRVLRGDFKQAAVAVNESKKLILSRDSSPLSQIIARVGEAAYSQYAGLHDVGIKAVFEGLDISRTTGVHVMDFLLSVFHVASLFDSGDFTTGRQTLQEIAPMLETASTSDTSLYYSLKTRDALFLGKFVQADSFADLMLRGAIKLGQPVVVLIGYLLKAMTLHALGHHVESEEYLNQAVNIVHQTGSKFYESWVLYLQALLALDKEHDLSALTILRKAFVLGRKLGFLNTFFDNPRDTARLCVKALAADIEVPFVQKIIRRRNLVPDESPVHLDNWPWALKILTLGRFALIINGKPMRFSKKAQQKPLSMLKVLIAFGGREIKEDRLADTLWPDADGDTAHQSYTTTLHRLRKLIGHTDAIQRRDEGLTLNPRYCWVDVWAFERLMGQAETGWNADNKDRNFAEAVGLTQKAIDFYQGPFLHFDTTESWAFPIRERLQSKFIRAVETLGNHWEKSGEINKAVECYRKSLEQNDLAEEIYRRLMACYLQLGQKSEAQRTYDRCRETLFASLGIEPSIETEVLRKEIAAS